MQGVTVYSLTYCPYCVRAKSLLKENEIEFKEIIVDPDDDNLRKELLSKSGMKTFPQIFNGEELVGGYTELKALHDEKGLKNVLKG